MKKILHSLVFSFLSMILLITAVSRLVPITPVVSISITHSGNTGEVDTQLFLFDHMDELNYDCIHSGWLPENNRPFVSGQLTGLILLALSLIHI